MKKILFLLFMIVFLPMIVLADASVPSILGYDAIVINKNGSQCIDYNHKYSYNEVIHVRDEYTYDNNWVAATEECNISLKDIVPYNKKEYIPQEKDIKKYLNGDNALLNKVNYVITVYEKDGLQLRKGPALAFGKYDEKIPFLQELKVTYEAGSWYYVNDNNYHGWVSLDASDHDTIALKGLGLMFFTEAKVVDDDNKVIFTIPKETFIDKIYDITDGRKLVEYNGQKGYINVFKDKSNWTYLYDTKYGYSVNGELLVLKDFDLVSLNGEKKRITKGEKIKVLYGNLSSYHGDDIYPFHSVEISEGNNQYYVEYQNIKGFISDTYVIQILDHGYFEDFETGEQDINLYSIDLLLKYKNSTSSLNENLKKKYQLNEIIKAHTKVDVLSFYGSCYIIKKNNNLFVILPFDKEDEQNTQEEINHNENNIIDNNEFKPINVDSNVKKDNKTIINAVIGSIILSVAIILFIIFFNKKKAKSKKEEVNIINENNITKEEKREVTITKNENIETKRKVTINDEEEKK